MGAGNHLAIVVLFDLIEASALGFLNLIAVSENLNSTYTKASLRCMSRTRHFSDSVLVSITLPDIDKLLFK